MCTDGILEARSPQAEYYPLAERLRAWVDLPTGDLLERLHEDLSEHVGGVPLEPKRHPVQALA